MTDTTIIENAIPKQRGSAPHARALIDVEPDFLRRADAVIYGRRKWGLGSAHAFCHDQGPKFTLIRGRTALYRPRDIDDWAIARIEAASTAK